MSSCKMIRPFKKSDIQAIVQIYYESIHSIDESFYTTDQKAAWANTDNVQQFSTNRLTKLLQDISFVYEKNNQVVGFIEMDHEGYIDMLFVHPSFQNNGIAQMLYDHIEKVAFDHHLPLLLVHASLISRYFFEKNMFQIITKQTITRSDVKLDNFIMKKELLEVNKQRLKLAESDRIFLSHWKEQDFCLYKDFYSNPEMINYIGGQNAFSTEKLSLRFKNELQSYVKNHYQYFPIFTIDGAFIGCCGLREVPEDLTVAELGFHLAPNYWGQGYAFDASQLVIKYALEILSISSIKAGHHPDNMNSEKVLKKLGFNFSKKEYYEPTGLKHPTYTLKIK